MTGPSRPLVSIGESRVSMGPRKKAVKSIYARLRFWQSQGISVTPGGMLEVKYYLKNHAKCAQVLIADPSGLALTPLPLPLDLPIFLSSQLQAQKAFADQPSLPVQICVTLQFAANHLTEAPIPKRSFPTLFRCQSSDEKRSFCLFAYIDFDMPSCTYTVPELLRLRGSQAPQALLDRVKSDPDLGEIMKQNGGPQPRRSRKTRDEPLSSTDSEEQIVFQGKRSARIPINNLDGETQWKYRGRNGSERNSNEPIAAPAGLDAQQNEGFQRFFKAVVSPTHVRVTAGGRIVPNTRNATSPTAKWDKDRSGLDSDSGDMARKPCSEARPDQNGSASQSATAIHPMMMPPMAHPMYPGYPPMYSPAMPYFPMPGGGMPIPYGVLQSQPHQSGVSAPLTHTTQGEGPDGDSIDMAKPISALTGAEEMRVKPAPIKISPPEQFDQSRPYFLNGNVIYPGMGPLPMQNQSTPMTPASYPGGYPAHASIAHAGSYSQPSPMMPSTGQYGPATPRFNSQMQAGPPNSAHQVHQATTLSPAGPLPAAAKTPVTSIKPSQITQSQLIALRAQVKYYEDQLQYNKHQIDEKATQEQVDTIVKLIGQFEQNLQLQLKFEHDLYPGGDKAVVSPQPDLTSCEVPSTPNTRENLGGGASQVVPFRPLQRQVSMPIRMQPTEQFRNKQANFARQRTGINCSKGADTSEALGALEAHLLQARGQEPMKRSALPTRAAMAPIFEPGGDRSSKPSRQIGDVDSNTSMTPCRDTPWNQGNSGSLLRQFPYLATKTGDDFAADPVSGELKYGNGPPNVPYLVGKLPAGIKAKESRSSEYTYPRELSQEEKRARHVFWGGVSNKGSGLPKFDGKDFYPPSPIQSSEKFDPASNVTRGRNPTGQTKVDISLEKIKKPEDPFRTMNDGESIRSTKSSRKLSHAVPIINPETMAREEVKIVSKTAKAVKDRVGASSEDSGNVPSEDAQSSPNKTPTATISERKSLPSIRRDLERSRGSSNDLWQNMMKKGSTSGAAAPGSVSSANANGFLPQSGDHAMASLSPAIANINGSMRAASDSKIGGDMGNQKRQTENMGENRPPSDKPQSHEDIIADLHQRMLRDAERRGVIGPGWK